MFERPHRQRMLHAMLAQSMREMHMDTAAGADLLAALRAAR